MTAMDSASERLIELASTLRDWGIVWKPAAGDAYVEGGPKKWSPVRYVGTSDVRMPDTLEGTVWLPTWEQCREMLSDLGWEIAAMSSYDGVRLELGRLVGR
jgi:hypothetical protein